MRKRNDNDTFVWLLPLFLLFLLLFSLVINWIDHPSTYTAQHLSSQMIFPLLAALVIYPESQRRVLEKLITLICTHCRWWCNARHAHCTMHPSGLGESWACITWICRAATALNMTKWCNLRLRNKFLMYLPSLSLFIIGYCRFNSNFFHRSASWRTKKSKFYWRNRNNGKWTKNRNYWKGKKVDQAEINKKIHGPSKLDDGWTEVIGEKNLEQENPI